MAPQLEYSHWFGQIKGLLTHAYLHAHVHTYLPTYIPPCLPTYLPACLPTYVRTYTHRQIYIYIYIYISNKYTRCLYTQRYDPVIPDPQEQADGMYSFRAQVHLAPEPEAHSARTPGLLKPACQPEMEAFLHKAPQQTQMYHNLYCRESQKGATDFWR